MNEQSTSEKRQRRRRVITSLYLVGVLAFGGFLLFGRSGGGTHSAAANGMDMAGMDMAGMAMPDQTGTPRGTPIATTAVHIKNFAFSPATITVKSGATVVWTNDDSIEHDVTFDGGAIASSTLAHNDTFSHTFTTQGTYNYICSIHPFMHGTVVVTG
jgi:amicyanin